MNTTTKSALFFWDGVLAGRYATKRLDKTLAHAVALVDVKAGRVRRAKWETLCGRIDADGMAGCGDDTSPRCERCEALAAKAEAV